MLKKLRSIFGGSDQSHDAGSDLPQPSPQHPELFGIRLGGFVEINKLKLSILESKGLLENPSSRVKVVAIGVCHVDDEMKIIRYYTDDEGFIQFNISGEVTDANVTECLLFYYSDTQGIQMDSDWDRALRDSMVEIYSYEGNEYSCMFGSEYDNGLIPITERVSLSYLVQEQSPRIEMVDQFFMLYGRDLGGEDREMLLVSCEEKASNVSEFDRCRVLSIGYAFNPVDLTWVA